MTCRRSTSAILRTIVGAGRHPFRLLTRTKIALDHRFIKPYRSGSAILLYALLMSSEVKDSNAKPRRGRISSKNQVTLPVAALERAHLGAGSRVVIEAEGPGRIVVRAVDDDFDRFVGCLAGVWGPGALDDLRNEWR